MIVVIKNARRFTLGLIVRADLQETEAVLLPTIDDEPVHYDGEVVMAKDYDTLQAEVARVREVLAGYIADHEYNGECQIKCSRCKQAHAALAACEPPVFDMGMSSESSTDDLIKLREAIKQRLRIVGWRV